MNVKKGRVFSRKTGKVINTKLVKEIHEYMHLDVVKMYKQEGILHILDEKKEHHKHDMGRVASIQIREHKRSGIQ